MPPAEAKNQLQGNVVEDRAMPRGRAMEQVWEQPVKKWDQP